MVVNNPNNWHWVDKNCISWTREYFGEKLTGLSVTQDDVKVGITAVSSVEGDVDVCQRKGKVISLFDIKLLLEFSGTSENTDCSGSIVVPELTYSSEEDDLQFVISIYESTTAKDETFKPLIRSQLLPRLRQVMIKFGKDLIITHGSDIQLESDKVNSEFTKANQESSTAQQTKNVSYQVEEDKKPQHVVSNVPKYNTSTLHLEPVFNTTAEQMYITLLDKARVTAWTRSLPIMDDFPPKEGSEIKLFGGGVSGKILKLVPNEQIIQLWRLEDWKEGHFAELDMKLVQGAGETKMVVKFSGIPIGEEDRVRGNFEDYYIRSIKITFGFGAVL
jgi:activator of HSP90 ATPase